MLGHEATYPQFSLKWLTFSLSEEGKGGKEEGRERREGEMEKQRKRWWWWQCGGGVKRLLWKMKLGFKSFLTLKKKVLHYHYREKITRPFFVGNIRYRY